MSSNNISTARSINRIKYDLCRKDCNAKNSVYFNKCIERCRKKYIHVHSYEVKLRRNPERVNP